MLASSILGKLRRVWRRVRDVPYPAACTDHAHYRRVMARTPIAAMALLRWRWRAILGRKRLILLVLHERMGDVVACEPAIAAARRHHPDDLIVWLIRAPFVPLLDGHPGLDGLIEIGCLTEWISLARLPLYDVSYDLIVNRKSCPGCGTTLSKTQGDPAVDTENYYDYGPLLVAFARSAGLELGPNASAMSPTLRIPESVSALVAKRLSSGPYIAIHASSDEESRDWCIEGWHALIDHARRVYKLTVVEIGLKSKLGISEADDYINLCGQCSLLETAELLRHAALFVGIDSGPAHLANAVGVPGLILLGYYRRWSSYLPYTGRYADPTFATLLRHEGPVGELPIAACLESFDARIVGSLRGPAAAHASSATMPGVEEQFS